ncbi:MAG: Killer protein [Stappia sp.]|uniref:type II toxin-antitoxin system RelE/ParE family toxin n=1 Tax=Stappia sp. TaxID=1870903 RepID=UPI000C39DF4A|nr:type II toxin-antitoxin system RelE/ParE family toxin [Stappia sp.]MAB00906.1 Killer protein [Stappia sp.]MBM22514.1 Killer protein [Stappia sp.]|tara:strand:- start:602 stop:880 length:279 start_codon:yes stop_codon:yes gene_type:complete
MIKDFRDPVARALFEGQVPRRFPADLRRVACRKLAMLDAAVDLNDLRAPPGNRLEALRGDRSGQYSIRINDQYRICFVWNDGAENVEITDYH